MTTAVRNGTFAVDDLDEFFKNAKGSASNPYSLTIDSRQVTDGSARLQLVAERLRKMRRKEFQF